MTREEAIKILNPATSFEALLGYGREEGIKVVEEASLLAIADMEKQIPKKFLTGKNMMTKEFAQYCPNCGRILENTNSYCSQCGQALWSEERG